jgi:RND family efflux transporter MFP subunit
LAEDVIEVSGSIAGKEEANAYSKVPGRLARYIKKEGDWVNKDDIIAWIERDEVGLQYSLSPVKAPISGLVAQRFVDIGESVSAGMGMPGTPVARVVNPSQLEINVNVIERDVSRVAIGQEAKIRVTSFQQETFVGEVSRISPVVDPMSRTSLVKIALGKTQGKLKSGMLADVKIIVGKKVNALLLPRDAILRQNRQLFVYVANQNRVQRKDIQQGWIQDDMAEIISGLIPADRVVVQGQTRLTETSLVKIVE